MSAFFRYAVSSIMNMCLLGLQYNENICCEFLYDKYCSNYYKAKKKIYPK